MTSTEPTQPDPSLLRLFVGAWTFDPERSDYGEQPMAEEALYSMVPRGDGLACEVRWTDAEGQRLRVGYDLVPDGVARPLPGLDGVSLRGRWERGEDGGWALISEALAGDAVAQRAVRRVADDTLTIVQQDLASGTRTLGVYARARVKQVILYRRDLKMRKGKIAAQVAHASMKAVLLHDRGAGPTVSLEAPGPMAVWLRTSFAKVVLSVETEQDLVKAWELAREAGIPSALITDSGRTEFGGVPTRTTVALGPWTAEVIDRISGPEGLVATKLA